jgi:hypothetical protein
MKNDIFLSLTVALAVSALSCGTPVERTGATADIVRGAVTITAGGQSMPLAAGARIDAGCSVATGPDGVAVISLNDGSARFEVQQDSEFDFQAVSAGEKKFAVRQGNVWNWVRKLKKDQRFTVDAPTAVVGVRGTKFYVFRLGDMDGVCHCEGSVETTDKASGATARDGQDTLSFSKNGKTVTLTSRDLASIGFSHDHSALPDSPLGAKNAPNPATMGKIMAIVADKFSRLK